MKRRTGRTAVGFTLIELVIVIIVLGILAALAVPSFTKTMVKEDERQARAMLQLIYSAERVYYLNTSPQTYTKITDPDDANEWRNKLNLDGPNATGQSVRYTVPSAGSNSFRAEAKRGSGTLRINQDGDISGGGF